MADLLSFDEIDASMTGATVDDRKADLSRASALAVTVEPDKHAENLRIADDTGIGVDVVQRNKDDILKTKREEDARLQAVFDDGADAPIWRSDPNNAAISSDYINAPAKWGNSLRSLGVSAYQGLGPDLAAGVGGAAEEISALTGMGGVQKFFGDYRKANQAYSSELDANKGRQGFVEQSINSGVKSLALGIPATAASVATGNPAPLLATFGLTTFGNSASTALDKGVSPEMAALYGASDAAVEIGTEALPAAKLIADSRVGSSFFKMLVNYAAAEVPNELVATTLQNLNEWAVINPDKPFETYLRSLPKDLAQTLIATVTSVGITTGIAKVASPTRERPYMSPEKMVQDITALHKDVQTDKLYQRSPERFRSLLSEMSNDERLYINADALNKVVASLPDDVRTKVFEQIPDLSVEFQVATATGVDISVSKADYTSVIAPYVQPEAIADYIKLDPADQSVAQQREFAEVLQQNPDLANVLNEDNNVNTADYEAAVERVVKKAMVKSGRSLDEARMVAPLFAKTDARFSSAIGSYAKGILQGSPLEFQSVDSSGQAFKQGSNVSVLLDDLVKQRAGGKVNLDEQTKTAVDDLYTRLETIGLTPEDAKAMPSEDLINALYPQSGAQAELQQIEKVPLPSGLDTNVFVNPTADQARALMQKSAAGIARSVKDEQGNLYMWDAYDLTHGDLMKHYGIPESQFNTTETHQSAERAAAVAESSSRSRTGKLNQSPIKTETEAFKKWFGDSKVVDEDGKPLVVYHGSTQDISSFDPALANPESDLGAGIYFSNAEDDIANNYAGEGPDLTAKISRRTDELEQKIYDQFQEKGRKKVFESFYRKTSDLLFASDRVAKMDDYEAAREAAAYFAKKELLGESPNTIPVYLSIKNPVVIEQSGGTKFDYAQAYDEETDEFGDEQGSLLDIINAARELEGEFGEYDSQKAIDSMFSEHFDDNEITAHDLIGNLKSSEGIMYANDENGNPVGNEIIRQIFARAGYDGFIDKTVNSKFGTEKKYGVAMKGMDENTVHYIAFNPEQVKSIFNAGEFNPENPNILQQQERGSIRMTKDAENALQRTIISFTEKADFSTAVHEFSHWAVATHRQFVNLARNGDQNNYAQQAIIKDWELLKSKVGADTDNFTVEQEEKVASWFEDYARNGKAPSEELRPIFSRFMDWFTRLYKDLRGLNSGIDPEIAGIFDRWLASEDEIAAVKNKNSIIVEIAQTLGLEGQLNTVANYINSAVFDAEGSVYRELSSEQRKRESKAYKDEFASLRKKVAEDVAKRPVYSLVNFLRESGQRVYIDPKAKTLGNAPELEFSPEDSAPVSLERMEAYHDGSMDSEQTRQVIIDMLLRPAPKKPMGITEWLAKKGGVQDESGDLLSVVDQKGKRGKLDAKGFRKGLVTKNGMQLDYAREAAIEARYLPEDAGIDDLLDAIRSESHGGNVFSEMDYEDAITYDSYQQAQEEAEKEGIDIDYEKLRRRKYGFYADLFTDDAGSPNAVRADEVAEMYGYESGSNMISVLRGTGDMDRVVDAETRNRLSAKYPDMIKDGRIKVKAVDAILNDKVMIALDVMVKEMGKRVGQNRVSMKQFAKVMAQQHLARLKVVDASYAFRYEVAREKELRSALQKGRDGNPQEAMLHLQRAMINQAMYKSLQDFKEVKDKAAALFKRVNDKDKNLAATTDIDFLGAARHLLSRFGLGGERFNYNAWKNDLVSRDPELFSDLQGMMALEDVDDKPAKQLTISEYTQLYDAVKNIFWASKNMKQFELGKRKIDADVAVAELVAKIDTMAKAPAIEGTQVSGKAKIHASIMGFKAVARRVESWVRGMDGADTGPFRDYIWQPISDASTAYRAARTEWMTGIRNIFVKHREHLLDPNKVSVPEIGKIFRDRREFIGWLLHTGNESNLEKLMVGYGSSVDVWLKAREAMIADGRLTKADMDVVQEIWDYCEGLKGLSQRAHKQLYGYRFEEIQATPLNLPFGVYRGGYYPASVNKDLVDTKDAEKYADELKRYTLATTNKGFTKARNAAFKKPLSTDLRLATSHIDEVLRLAYLEAPVRQVSRLLNKEQFKTSLRSIDPKAYGTMLLPYLQRAAAQQTSMPSQSPAFREFEPYARWMRSSVSANTMMLNVSNALQNYTSLPIVMYRVGPRNFAKGLSIYLKNPAEATKQVRSLSLMMQTRQNVLDVEVSSEIREIIERTGPYTKVKTFATKHGYVLQRLTQGSIDTAAWLAAYNQKIGEVSEIEAVKYADSVVRETQSSSNPEDISAIENGSDLAKIFLMFYTYFNSIGNFAGTEFRTMIRKSGFVGAAPQAFYLYAMVVAIPAITGDLLVKALRDDLPQDDDDDGEVLDDWLSYIAGSQLRYISATVPFAGQAFNSFLNMALTKSPQDDRITGSPIFGMIERAARVVYKTAGDGYNDASSFVRDAFSTIGFLTGLPLGQLGKPAAFVADVKEGDARPKNAGEWVRGVIGGPTPTR